MLKYALYRLLLVIPTLIGIAVIVFLVLRVVPGDPVAIKLTAESGEVTRAELLTKLALRALAVEMPGRAFPDRAGRASGLVQRAAFGDQQFGRAQPLEFRGQRVLATGLERVEPATGQFQPGEPELVVADRDCREQGVAALLE